MGRVAVLAREGEVERVLGVLDVALGHFEARAAQPRSADQDEERLDALATRREIGEPASDEVSAGEGGEARRRDGHW